MINQNSPEDYIAKIVAYHVRKLRDNKGWSQEDLADRMGVKFQYISQIETGRRGIGKRTLKKLSRALNVLEKELIMPVEIGSQEFQDLWKKFYNLTKGNQKELFEKTIDIFELIDKEEVPPEVIKTMQAQIEFIYKMLIIK